MSEINVLYAFDTKFWKLAAVSMYSLLKNQNSDTRCTIYCMVAPHTAGRRQIIKKIIKHFPNVRLVWRPIKKSENPYKSYDFSRWSPVIFYRLFASQIFPNVDKMLYLDSDTLVCADLTELFNTDISNYAMGAVRDMAPTEDPINPNGVYAKEFSEKYLNRGPYFNSGVLLLNMKNMAKSQQLLTNVKATLKYPDQNILNVGLLGQIHQLDLKYNLVPGLSIPKTFPPEQATAAKTAPAILHFYAAKPYYYTWVPREAYSIFYKTSTALGMYPEDFIALEQKYLRRRARKASKIIAPLRVHNDRITLFGITLTRL